MPSRAELLAYAAAMYKNLLAESGVGNTDVADGLKYPLDRTFAALGTDTSSEAAYALIDYHTLRNIANAIAAVVDAQGTGFSAGAGGQVSKRVHALLELATVRVEAFGYPNGGSPDTTGGMNALRVNLDYIQPVDSAGI